MSRVEKLEQRIDQKLRHLLRSSPVDQPREPIELYRAILEEITSRVDAVSRGRRKFAYALVTVRVLLTNPERRPSYELAFTEADPLTRDLKSRVEESQVDYPARLKVDVVLVDTPPAEVGVREFEISYSNPPAAAPGDAIVPIRLTILAGNAEQQEYEFARQRIQFGRLAEVLDSDSRIVRLNDIAFKDDATLENSTVSRAHAHLEFDPEGKGFRLFDDGSAHGTTVIRDGSVLAVPRGNSKGILLRPGDEIMLAKVRIRFEPVGN